MASAQVISNSGADPRKTKHLEAAGKRRLEEFRKKKAAERAKKASSAGQPLRADEALKEKQSSESDLVRVTDSDGAATSDGVGGFLSGPSSEVIDNDMKATDFGLAGPTKKYGVPRIFDPPLAVDVDGNSSQYSNFGPGQSFPSNNDDHQKDFMYASPGTSNSFVDGPGNILPENKSGYSDPLAGGSTSSYYEGSVHHATNIVDPSYEVEQSIGGALMYITPFNPQGGQKNSSESGDRWTSASSPSLRLSEFRLMGSSDHVPPCAAVAAIAGMNTKRSRPSFLDDILPSATSPLTDPDKADSSSSKGHPEDGMASSASQISSSSLVAGGNLGHLFSNGVNGHSEDFAALEQHIEDLTHEKFSLQRALEATRTLAESLASDNSALTDSYNQQGSVVHQLKSDMEKLQEEVKTLLVELESLKIEYANAQLECNAADERSKLLASEVIGLEEKALRLRSSELKLERQLENSQAEFSLLKRKISSLEKERQDLQSTVDALQEEKKFLHTKLRKASANEKFSDASKSQAKKRSASTSTEDLGDRDDAYTTADTSNVVRHATASFVGSDSSSQPQDRQFSLEELSLSIPPDQLRMVQNIYTSISELALEKEELKQGMSAVTYENSQLKESCKELSRKLEVQTQRFELLTAQIMANDDVLTRQPDSRPMQANPAYADEGDEVVERVLGWIMKLFPGGPSRRQTSKLL